MLALPLCISLWDGSLVHSKQAVHASRKLCRSVREDLFLQSIQPFQYVLDYTLCAWVQRLNLLSK